MDTKIIDVVALNEEDKVVNLLIIDDLNWFNPEEHIDRIQEKILKYVIYVEEGQLTLSYPSIVDHKVIIKVIFKCPLSEEGFLYIQEAQSVLADVGFNLEFLNYEDL